MKKILSALLALYLLAPAGYSQDNEIRPKAIGVSFFLNDFVTASRIRNTSLNQVISDKSFAKLKDMNPGLAITYFKGLKKHLDAAISLGGSFLRYPMPNKSFVNDRFLLE